VRGLGGKTARETERARGVLLVAGALVDLSDARTTPRRGACFKTLRVASVVLPAGGGRRDRELDLGA
jgi:hypothetical protein